MAEPRVLVVALNLMLLWDGSWLPKRLKRCRRIKRTERVERMGETKHVVKIMVEELQWKYCFGDRRLG